MNLLQKVIFLILFGVFSLAGVPVIVAYFNGFGPSKIHFLISGIAVIFGFATAFILTCKTKNNKDIKTKKRISIIALIVLAVFGLISLSNGLEQLLCYLNDPENNNVNWAMDHFLAFVGFCLISVLIWIQRPVDETEK